MKKLLLAGVALFLASSAWAYGPRVPTGPQASITCTGTAVTPANAVATFNAGVAGRTYCMGAGTYSNLTITPRNGDSYIGAVGAIMDGTNTTTRAFGGTANTVTIKNLEVKRYNASNQQGQIAACDGGTTNWVIANNNVHDGGFIGINFCGANTIVQANKMWNNGQEGFGCASGSNMQLLDNEIYNNNYNETSDPDYEAGGGKCAANSGMIMSWNSVHDNHGPGLWCDEDCENTRYEGNDISNNWQHGLFHEISWDAVIIGNYVNNNGHVGNTNQGLAYCRGWLWCAQITIAASGGWTTGKTIEVQNNIVIATNNAQQNGIALIQQDRATGTHGTRLVQNVHVHNNDITQSSGSSTGAVTDIGATAMYTSRGNSFNNDAYHGTNGSNSYSWNDTSGNFNWFQTQGQELSGTFGAASCQ